MLISISVPSVSSVMAEASFRQREHGYRVIPTGTIGLLFEEAEQCRHFGPVQLQHAGLMPYDRNDDIKRR